MTLAEDTAPETSRSLRGAEVHDSARHVTVETASSQPLSRGRLLFAHMNSVVRKLSAKQMPVEPRMVLTVMVDHANAEGIAWPAVETIANMSGMSEATARKSLRALVEHGWLTLLGGKRGGRTTARYRINLDGRPFETPSRPAPQGDTAQTPGVRRSDPRGARHVAQGCAAATPGVRATLPRGAPRIPDPHSDPLTDPHNEPPIYPRTPEAPPEQPAAEQPAPLVLTPPGVPARAKRKAPAPRAEHPMPADWKPTPAHEALAKREGVDLVREEERFRFWAEGKLATSWNGRFSTWLLKAGEDRRARGEPEYAPPILRHKIPLVPPPPIPLRRSTFEEQRAKQAAALERLRIEEEARMAERAANPEVEL